MVVFFKIFKSQLCWWQLVIEKKLMTICKAIVVVFEMMVTKNTQNNDQRNLNQCGENFQKLWIFDKKFWNKQFFMAWFTKG